MTAKETWKPVTIGGLTGILMGAGAMYGVQALATATEHGELATGAEEGLKVATVDDSLSFGKAFEAARAEVGPGGVFTWRGHIYNTYTAAEWKEMSHDEKELFAEQVKPEVSAADVDTNQIAANDAVSENNEDVTVAEVESNATAQSHDVEVQGTQEPANQQVTTWNEIAQEKNDVRVVGFKEIEVGNGRSIAMQELEINGQRVAVIDVDKDGDPDLAMTDLNHNHQMDEGEVIDLHTGEAISFANDDPADVNMPDVDTFNA